MQIILEKVFDANDQVAQYAQNLLNQFIRLDAFLEVDEINIAKVSTSFNAKTTYRFNLDCRIKDPEIEGELFFGKLESLVAELSGIKLVNVLFPYTKMFDGINRISNNAYRVDLQYAKELCKDPEYRAELVKKKISYGKMEYSKVGPNSFRYTGRLHHSIFQQSGERPELSSYDYFLSALDASKDLRDLIESNHLSSLLLKLNEDDSFSCEVTSNLNFSR